MAAVPLTANATTGGCHVWSTTARSLHSPWVLIRRDLPLLLQRGRTEPADRPNVGSFLRECAPDTSLSLVYFHWLLSFSHGNGSPHPPSTTVKTRPVFMCNPQKDIPTASSCRDSFGFDRYLSVDESGYSRDRDSGYGGRGGHDQGGEGRGGRGAVRGVGRGQGPGRAGRRGRRGYFTDGRGGEALDYYEGDSLSRGGRSSRQAGGRGRGRGRGQGRNHSERGERRQHKGSWGDGGEHGARTEETGRGGVWGYEDDDDDDVVGLRPSRAPAATAVKVESPYGADGEVDDGSLSSRMGPVDREHFYSIKVLLLLALLSSRTIVRIGIE